jgi:hypothetical protein
MENKIIEIWKEIIYLSAKYSNYTEEEKNKLLVKFNEYKIILSKGNSKYSDTVNDFLIDLESDLTAGRKLQIDKIDHDDYLENYFISQREINHYNSLIDEKLYNKIFEEINTQKDLEKITKYLLKLEKNFSKQIKLISSENISKNLLIFSLFEKKLVSNALKNLSSFTLTIPNSKLQLQLIHKLIHQHNNLIQKIYLKWIENYRSKTFNVFYMKFESEIINGEKIKNLKKYNSVQRNFRTWNPEYEYKKILKKIIEY